MRKMGIDYGDARIGIALSDPMCVISSPYEVYKTRGWQADIPYLANLAREKAVDTIVIGDPLNMDGSSGDRSRISHEFGVRLAEATGLPIVYVDERLTTVEMEEFLESQNLGWKKRKAVVDKLSAQLILKNYLDGIELQRIRTAGNKE